MVAGIQARDTLDLARVSDRAANRERDSPAGKDGPFDLGGWIESAEEECVRHWIEIIVVVHAGGAARDKQSAVPQERRGHAAGIVVGYRQRIGKGERLAGGQVRLIHPESGVGASIRACPGQHQHAVVGRIHHGWPNRQIVPKHRRQGQLRELLARRVEKRQRVLSVRVDRFPHKEHVAAVAGFEPSDVLAILHASVNPVRLPGNRARRQDCEGVAARIVKLDGRDVGAAVNVRAAHHHGFAIRRREYQRQRPRAVQRAGCGKGFVGRGVNLAVRATAVIIPSADDQHTASGQLRALAAHPGKVHRGAGGRDSCARRTQQLRGSITGRNSPIGGPSRHQVSAVGQGDQRAHVIDKGQALIDTTVVRQRPQIHGVERGKPRPVPAKQRHSAIRQLDNVVPHAGHAHHRPWLKDGPVPDSATGDTQPACRRQNQAQPSSATTRGQSNVCCVGFNLKLLNKGLGSHA